MREARGEPEHKVVLCLSLQQELAAALEEPLRVETLDDHRGYRRRAW